MSTSAILGILILFGALAVVILFLKSKNEKEYRAGMAEYERKMAEYEAAMAALAGDAPAAPAASAAPAAAVAAAPSALSGEGTGEVKLTGVDEETAAAIITAVSCVIGGNAAGFCVKSIAAA